MGSHVPLGHLFAPGISLKPFITHHNPASFNSNGTWALLMCFCIPFCLPLPTLTSHALPFSVQSQSGVPTAMPAHFLAYRDG